jgi:hypothetical protein
MFSPFTHTSPDVGLSIPPMILSTVLFPEPLGPRTTTNSPLSTSKLMPSEALTFTWPIVYSFTISFTVTIGSLVTSPPDPYVFDINQKSDFFAIA